VATNLPPGIITTSPLVHAVFRDVAVIAPSETRVLITGEKNKKHKVRLDLADGPMCGCSSTASCATRAAAQSVLLMTPHSLPSMSIFSTVSALWPSRAIVSLSVASAKRRDAVGGSAAPPKPYSMWK
jgi:hypothetical protein